MVDARLGMAGGKVSKGLIGIKTSSHRNSHRNSSRASFFLPSLDMAVVPPRWEGFLQVKTALL